MDFSALLQIRQLDKVELIEALQSPIQGRLCLISHHIILSTGPDDADDLWCLYENIDAIEKKKSSGVGGAVVIKCKDLRIFQLNITSSDNDFNALSNSLETRCCIADDPGLKYPFFFSPIDKILDDGWTMFSTEIEFGPLLKDDWRISYINSDFALCPTYPKAVVVPKCIDDDSIKKASRFREGGRFPVLIYRHENVPLLRSSQPLIGPTNKRSKDDEKLLNCALVHGKKGYVVDTRNFNLAQAAKARGGGYELDVHYPQWKRVHNPIDRHTNLLESLSKLVDACNDVSISSDKWLSKLDSSGWLTYIRDSLNCACLAAQFLDQEGSPVLVHGGEGMDATLIVTSLSQIILNPDCRTVRGFQAVIEREWIQAGYPFSKRHAHSCYSPVAIRTKDEAPSFLLFLDCVQQIHSQFPCSFEFSTNFLMLLFEHSYASKFGTFLCNNESERERYELSKKTPSLWTHLNQLDVLPTILNPLYERNNSVIWPSVAPVSLSLWSGVFLRWVTKRKTDQDILKKTIEIKEKEKDCRALAVKLTRQLAELEKELMAVNSE